VGSTKPPKIITKEFPMKFKLLKKLMMISALCISPLMASAEVVNINDASAAALSHYLKGVGTVKAESIVNYRKLNGDFKNINDIVNVKGIGKGILKKNLDDLSLTEGVVKWIKAKPKLVSIDNEVKVKRKPKKVSSNKLVSKVVSKPATKKVKKKKAADLNLTKTTPVKPR